MKGESAFWINKEKITHSKFEWAAEYYAASVSESIIPKVVAYIENQEAHHTKKTYAEECEEFLSKYNINHG
ncbi:MAG TPA: transposase [Bacteroidia bacterium]